MDEQTWYSIKAKYPIGTFIRGKVIQHQSFGVFLDIGEQGVKGLIRITDFGVTVGGIIYENSDSENAQINLTTKPSIIHDFLMNLRKQDEIDPTYLQDM
jgi:ribosomal protein S1